MVAPSLSLVLTAHNAQGTLTSRVVELLELVAELTPDFEVLIVDDGSTDSTEEVAHELTRQYPQIRVVRHDVQQGAVAAAETGMQKTRGEIVFWQDLREPTQASEMKRLWRLREYADLAIARRERPAPFVGSNLLERLLARMKGTQPHTLLGLQMIRRKAVPQWRRENAPPETRRSGEVLRADPADSPPTPNFLTHVRDFALGE